MEVLTQLELLCGSRTTVWKEEPLTKSSLCSGSNHSAEMNTVVYVSLLYQQTTLVTQGACLARPLKLIVVVLCFAHPVGMNSSRTTVWK